MAELVEDMWNNEYVIVELEFIVKGYMGEYKVNKILTKPMSCPEAAKISADHITGKKLIDGFEIGEDKTTTVMKYTDALQILGKVVESEYAK